MKTIPLTQGLFALVDDQDFDVLNQFQWAACKHENTYYARRKENQKTISMHCVILSRKDKPIVDHIDGNGLNNQRSNLRPADWSENNQNKKIRRDNRSGFKGVFKLGTRYYAQLKIRGKKKSLGGYPTAIKAALAYDRAALDSFGEFAKTNFDRQTLNAASTGDDTQPLKGGT